MGIFALVTAITAPLVIVLLAISAIIRRHGALPWAIGIAASWGAGLCIAAGEPLAWAAVALGSATSVLLYIGARRYAGRPRDGRVEGAMLLLPVALGTLEASVGPPAGEIAMAVSDTGFLAATIWRLRATGPLASILTARLLPWSVAIFLVINLGFQANAIAGASMALPEIAQSFGLVLIAAMMLAALSARVAFDDALERSRLEATLREREDALARSEQRTREAERLATVGAISAGIAHQINNPIGGILAATQLELLRVRSGDTGDTGEGAVRETLETIEREALRCARIVRDVLRFARSRSELAAPTDLGELARRAVTTTRSAVKNAGVELRVDLSNTPLPIRANDVEIEEAIVNLVLNATECAETVTLSTRRVGDLAECVVEDDGPGIPEEIADRVFDPFVTTRIRSGGSGLGLSVVHGVVTSHGGEVSHEQREPSGTRFRIRLPLTPPAAAPSSTPSPQ